MSKLIKYFFIFCLATSLSLFIHSDCLAATDLYYTPQISFTGSPSGAVDGLLVAQYIIGITKYAIGIIGIIATVVMMFGGFRWLTAGGNSEAISDAKAWITASLTGLALALCSFLILATINPKLTEFKKLEIKEIDKYKSTMDEFNNITDATTGCCLYKNGSGLDVHDTKSKKACETYRKSDGDSYATFCPGTSCVQTPETVTEGGTYGGEWECSDTTKTYTVSYCTSSSGEKLKKGTICQNNSSDGWCDGSGNCVGKGTSGQWCGYGDGKCEQGAFCGGEKSRVSGGRDCDSLHLSCCK